MKRIRLFLFGSIIVGLILWGLDFSQTVTQPMLLQQDELNQQNDSPAFVSRRGDHYTDQSLGRVISEETDGLSLYNPSLNLSVSLGMSRQQLEQAMGQPERVEPSAYGYQWWIYVDHWDQYIQVGLRDEKVNSIYTNSREWRWQEWAIGLPYEAWSQIRKPEEELSFSSELGFFTFLLNPQEKKERPLFLINDELAIQLYIDVHDGERIAGIRLLELYTLLVQKPYTVRYIGSLPQPPELTAIDQAAVEAAYERQIFELVNVTRFTLGLNPLQWDGQVADVARGHSADMAQHHYFNHHSPRFGDLGQRLDQSGVTFIKAGENIAWNYVDAADVHHGWMNSPGHRQNMVEPDFTHLGVGVVERYFTQNFIQASAEER